MFFRRKHCKHICFLVGLILSTIAIDSSSFATEAAKNTKVYDNTKERIIVDTVISKENEKLVAKHLQKAIHHMDAGELDKVIPECEAAIELNPSLSHSYAILGTVLNQMMQWRRAVEAWRAAASLEPNSFDYAFHLGFSISQMALDEMNQKKKFMLNKEGISVLMRAIALGSSGGKADEGLRSDSQLSMTHSHLGGMYKTIKTQDKQLLSIESFEKAVDLDPTNELAFFNLGLLFSTQFDKTDDEQDKVKALENLEKAIELQPESKHFRLVRDALLGEVTQTELMAAMQHSDL